jgi:hypothetical protein
MVGGGLCVARRCVVTIAMIFVSFAAQTGLV